MIFVTEDCFLFDGSCKNIDSIQSDIINLDGRILRVHFQIRQRLMDIIIRQANISDAENIRAIYSPIVEGTAISFELVAPDESEIASRITTILKTHDWLVACEGAEVVGYAYASEYRTRQAYRFSAETTVYVKDGRRGAGIAKRLYEALFESLNNKGFRRAFAGIALPNVASIATHKALGFTEIGVFSEAGFKFDQWHDVAWWQRRV